MVSMAEDVLCSEVRVFGSTAFGLGEIYEDTTSSAYLEKMDWLSGKALAEPEDAGIVSNDTFFGLGSVINGFYGIFRVFVGFLFNVFKIMTFSDPRIPYLLYVFVFLPANLSLLLATISLFTP